MREGVLGHKINLLVYQPLLQVDLKIYKPLRFYSSQNKIVIKITPTKHTQKKYAL